MAQLLFIAVETFVTERRDRSEIVNAGEVAGSRSWVVDVNPSAFRPLEVRWPDPPVPPVNKDGPEPSESGGVSAAVSVAGAQKPVSPASLKRGPGRPRKT